MISAILIYTNINAKFYLNIFMLNEHLQMNIYIFINFYKIL